MRVLVVEDEALVAMDLERQLRRAGYDVVGPFRSVRDSLQALDDQKPSPDVAVLDYSLVGETSEPVAERLAERGVPFFFTTGFAATEVIKRSAFADRPRLSKPCAFDELRAQIVELTG